ncbi:hypothetical protein ACFLW2_01260 [Chloroflexota bacterium]
MTGDQWLRVLAVFLEVLVLSGIVFSLLLGARLIMADFGIGPKYNKILAMALIASGCILVIFFSTHLSAFYPSI